LLVRPIVEWMGMGYRDSAIRANTISNADLLNLNLNLNRQSDGWMGWSDAHMYISE